MNVRNSQDKGNTAASLNLVNQLWSTLGGHASTPREVWSGLVWLATENQRQG